MEMNIWVRRGWKWVARRCAAGVWKLLYNLVGLAFPAEREAKVVVGFGVNPVSSGWLPGAR
jgi:hypothetical protein